MNIDHSNLPQHVAFIMDGNRRWAREQNLSQLQGHTKGVDVTEPIIDHAIKLGIPYLTFWAFSTENWRRSKQEVEFLLKIFRESLDKKIDDWHQKNVRIHVIGNLSMFPKDLQDKSQGWMEKTKKNTTITVTVALSYGGRDEIARAINCWHDSTKRQAPSAKLTTDELEKYLDTAGQPDPDLLIRTGGEQRLSGFLLWQLEYTELYFTKTLWPAFSPDEFDKILSWYQKQKRNFGR